MENLVLKVMRAKSKTALTPEEEAMFTALGESVNEALSIEKVERNKKIDEIATQLGTVDAGQDIAGIIRALAQKVDEVEEKSKRTLSEADKKNLRAVLEANKDVIRNSRNRTTPAWEVEFKAKRAASALMTTGTVLAGAVAINNPNELDDLQITFIKYPNNFILDAINSRQVSKVPASRRWKEQVVANDGVPTVVTEGNTKPLTDYKFEYKYSYVKKYAGRIEMTEEVEIDMEQLMMEIITMFERDVLKVYQAGVFADILAWAPAYTTTALDGTLVNPQIRNVVNAGVLAVAVNNYTADTLIINPADYALGQNMENSMGDPIFVPDSVMYPGFKLFVTSLIDAGTLLVGEGAIVEEQHGGFILRRGTYGTQFIENEFTIVGEVFSNLKLPTESKKGWVKIDIATVKGLLLKAPVAI